MIGALRSLGSLGWNDPMRNYLSLPRDFRGDMKPAGLTGLAVLLLGAAVCAGGTPLSVPFEWGHTNGTASMLGTAPGQSGGRGLKITMPENRSLHLESRVIALDPRKSYRLLYHYRTGAVRVSWSAVSVEFLAPGRSLGFQSILFLDNQADWKKKEYLLLTPAPATACKIHLRVLDAGEYWVDGPSLAIVDGAEAARISLIGKMDPIPVRKVDALPRIPPEGRYSVRPLDGVWWLFDPQGQAFWNLSLWGGGPISDEGELPLRKYIKSTYLDRGRTAEYDNRVFDRLISWGFNSIGSGIEIGPMNRALQMRRQDKAPTLPYVDTIVMSLNLPGRGGFRLWEIAEVLYGVGQVKIEDLSMLDRNFKPVLGAGGAFPDVFSEKFRKAYDLYVREWFEERHADDLFAVCLDNEMPWADLPRVIYSPACRREFAKFAATRFEGRIDRYNARFQTRLANFQEIETHMPPDANGVYRELIYEFLRHYVKEYIAFQIATVRKYRPDILTIGQRLAGAIEMDGSARMASSYDWCADLFSAYDIIGLNVYPRGQDHFAADQLKFIEWFHRKTGRPIIITEWCVCCEESGVPTTLGWPLWSTVHSWSERGQGYRNCITQLACLPYVVGAHWFAAYNGYYWDKGVRHPGYNHGFYQDEFEPNPLFLKQVLEANKLVSHLERKADFSPDRIIYLKE